jgi:hypothetical protein
LQIKTKMVSCHTADSKPVKQEVNGTVIPLIFPALSEGAGGRRGGEKGGEKGGRRGIDKKGFPIAFCRKSLKCRHKLGFQN